MRIPNKFYFIVDAIILILLILSFLYLFIAVLTKYNLFFDFKSYFALLVPVLGSIATVVLALLTFRMVQEMKLAREEERRPYVYVDFLFDSNIIFVVVKNTGRNGAKNIKFTFSKPLISSKKRNISEIKLFKEGLDFLPPNKEIKTWLDTAPSFYKSGLPTSYDVEVQYIDVVSNNEYTEKFRLDLETYKGIIYLDRKTIHNVVEELKNINKVLQGWSSGSGFLIETKKERETRHKEVQEYFKKTKKKNSTEETDKE